MVGGLGLPRQMPRDPLRTTRPSPTSHRHQNQRYIHISPLQRIFKRIPTQKLYFGRGPTNVEDLIHILQYPPRDEFCRKIFLHSKVLRTTLEGSTNPSYPMFRDRGIMNGRQNSEMHCSHKYVFCWHVGENSPENEKRDSSTIGGWVNSFGISRPELID